MRVRMRSLLLTVAALATAGLMGCPAEAFSVRQASPAADGAALVWGGITEGLALGAEPVLSTTQAGAGEPGVEQTTPSGALRFVLWNPSPYGLLVAESYAEHDYRLTVIGPRGEELAVRPSRQNLPVWTQGTLVLAPNEELVDEYDLAQMYDLSEDGAYRIVARRHVFRLDGEGFGEVISAPITVYVTNGQVAAAPGAATKLALAPRPLRAQATPQAEPLHWGAVSEGFSLAVEGLSHSDASSPDAAATGKLRFVLKNVSDRRLEIVVSYPEHDYRLTVIGPGGDLLTALPDIGGVTRRFDRTVEPGEQVVEEYHLALAYRLKEDGWYRIVPHRFVPRLDGKGSAQVTAPPITVLVANGQVVSMSDGNTTLGLTPRPWLTTNSWPSALQTSRALDALGMRQCGGQKR